MKKINKLIPAFPAIVISLLLFNGCQNFYKTIQAPIGNNTERTKSIDSLKLQNRYFVLRNGSHAYKMTDISLSTDKKSLNCTLDTLEPEHLLHLKNGRRGKMQYDKSDPEENEVMNEVHFFIPQDNTIVMGPNKLQLENIQKIEILQKDKKRTTNSYVIGAIGITLGSLALVAIIIAATKSSCPFVSAYDGQAFSLQGEIYGGAIYPQLARHDYMPLKMGPLADGSLQLKISNELKERQFTDMAELWVISHDKNSYIIPDENGNLYSVSDPKSPTSVSLNGHIKLTTPLLKAGDNTLLYMDDTTAGVTNELVMKFNKPAAARKAKLVLGIKNSYFLDLLYGELAKGFGNYYNTYVQQQRKKSAAELLTWVKQQHIPLEISVKTNSGWKKVTELTTIGPLATRNMVVPVDFPEMNETVTEIRLSSGFMFWEIDYVALDFSEATDFTVSKVNPSTATDELGKNILPDLEKEDGLYLAQPDIGNTATLVYHTGSLSDVSKTRSYVLHTKGYYEHVRDFKNKPDVAFLNRFKHPGAFPLFGMQLFRKMTSENLKTLAISN